MDIQFSLGLGHPEIPKATRCMPTELTGYSTFSQTPSSLHTTGNTESSFKLSSTGFGRVKLLQWQHTPMQLYFKKSTGTDLPKLALTLYQKFTVMVIPPFRRDSMWCHLHGDSTKKNQKLLLQLIGKYLANIVCSNCIGQSWPYTSTTKTTELLMKYPYLNTDPFLAYVSREHTQQCIRENYHSHPKVWSTLAQVITENIILAGTAKQNFLKRHSKSLKRRTSVKPLFAGHSTVPIIILTST